MNLEPEEPLLELPGLQTASQIRLKGICFRVDSWKPGDQSFEADGNDIIVLKLLGRAQQNRELRETQLDRMFNLVRASDRAVLEALFVSLNIDTKQPMSARLNALVGKYVEITNIQA